MHVTYWRVVLESKQNKKYFNIFFSISRVRLQILSKLFYNSQLLHTNNTQLAPLLQLCLYSVDVYLWSSTSQFLTKHISLITQKRPSSFRTPSGYQLYGVSAIIFFFLSRLKQTNPLRILFLRDWHALISAAAISLMADCSQNRIPPAIMQHFCCSDHLLTMLIPFSPPNPTYMYPPLPTQHPMP